MCACDAFAVDQCCGSMALTLMHLRAQCVWLPVGKASTFKVHDADMGPQHACLFQKSHCMFPAYSCLMCERCSLPPHATLCLLCVCLPVCACVQTSHITPRQAGPVLSAIRPRLASLHHLTVNDASRVAIVSHVRAGYPEGVLFPHC